MTPWSAVVEVVLLLLAAAVLGVLARRLGQPPLLGALVAGLVLGPDALGVVDRGPLLDILGELGVALLLFTIGLELTWTELRHVGKRAIRWGALQIAVTIAAAALYALAEAENWRTALVVGAMVALSSTACVLGVLRDRAEDDASWARSAMAILVFQDLALVPLVVLVAALGGAKTPGSVALALAWSAVAAALLVGGLMLLSRRVLPRLMGAVSATGTRDLPILVAVATCLGASWAAHEMGVSPAMGAFVAGVLLSNSPFATRVRSDVSALRALFVTTFFASIGMLASPAWIVQHPLRVAFAVILILVGKALIVALIGAWLRHRIRHAVATALCLAQVGEFAFVLASVARSEGLLDPDLSQLLLTASVVSLLVTPWLVSIAPRVGRVVEQAVLDWRARIGLGEPPDAMATLVRPPRLRGHVIVVGLGPAGRGACLDLIGHGVRVLALDISVRGVREAEREGIPARVGDGAQEEVLAQADVEGCRAVIVAIPELRVAIDVIEAVRAKAGHVPVIARARHHVHALHLLAAGAAHAVDEEWEMGGKLGVAARAALSEAETSPAIPRSAIHV
jgi:CPA2 family monovalent cation:H+ antiporter-2